MLVLNKADATLHVIETASGALLDTEITGTGPHEVAISADGTRAVIANYGDQSSVGESLLVYDIVRGQLEFTVDLAPHQRPHGLAFLGGRDRVLVTSETSQAILDVDLATRAVTRVMKTNEKATHMLALAPDGSRVFTANIASGTVSEIDLVTGLLVRSVKTGKQPEAIEITPDGRELWVGHNGDHKLVVLDTQTFLPLGEVACATLPIRVKCTPDGRAVLVSCALSGEVAWIDRASRKEIHRFQLARRNDMDLTAIASTQDDNPTPVGIVIEPSGRYAFVACTGAARIDVLDLERRVVCASWPAGQAPDGIGWAAEPVNPARAGY